MSTGTENQKMSVTDQLTVQFKSFFVGDTGSFQRPGNFGGGRTVAAVCRQILACEEPFLFETLEGWDKRNELRDAIGKPVNIFEIARQLHSIAQWEGAWAVAQLHYDQRQKKEAQTGARQHKGHPACGLAILGQLLGSHSLVRHFAQLSSAGDIYFEHEEQELKHGGLAPTILEQYESSSEHELWRQRVRQQMEPFQNDRKPLYLEAFVAARWFGKRCKWILELADSSAKKGMPFPDVLLDAVESDQQPNTTCTGTRFEAATGLLLSATPGFEVRSARLTDEEQVDLVVWYERDRLSRLALQPGPGLVECKFKTDPKRPKVSVSELRDFGAKCQFHRVGFGILVTRAGVTGSGAPEFEEPKQAELVRRRLLVDGLTVLVLDISQLRGTTQQLRGLQDALASDHDRLVFGPIAGETDPA